MKMLHSMNFTLVIRYYTCMYRYVHIFNLKNKTCGSNNEY